MKKPFPPLASDEAAEAFVANADLSDYDFSGFVPMRFEFARKDASISLRLPKALLQEVTAAAVERGMPAQRFIRLAIEAALRRP